MSVFEYDKKSFVKIFRRKIIFAYLVVGLIGCFIGLAGLIVAGIYVIYVYGFTSNWVHRVILILLPFPFITYIVGNGFHISFEAFSRLLRISSIIDVIKGEG